MEFCLCLYYKVKAHIKALLYGDFRLYRANRSIFNDFLIICLFCTARTRVRAIFSRIMFPYCQKHVETPLWGHPDP